MKFNELLETYRSQALPALAPTWTELTDDAKQPLEKMFNFFCGLHSLVNLATTAQATLIDIEKGLFTDQPPIHDRSFASDKEAGTTRMIRTACKAFAMGGK